MAELLMRDLESASQIVLAPPNIVTHQQRMVAENVILTFRKSKLPYNNCKYLLENSKNHYVVFQAATAIKECVVKEWSLLSSDDIESLRVFLLKYITENISLQSFAREAILQAVAVILKRGCTEEKKASSEQLFNDLTQLMGSGNVTMQLIACSMITSLLNEFSSGGRASYVGLTWEFHMRCKKSFEERELKKVFLFCVRIVQDFVMQTAPLTTENMAVFNRLLAIIEQTLNWTFTPKHIMKRMVGSFEVGQNPVLRPTASWRDVLLNTDFIQLLFQIHKKVHTNSEMSHHSLQSLAQLASLTGDVFDTDRAKVQYLSCFVQSFLHMLTSIHLCDHENLHIANLCKNLVSMFSFDIWSQLDSTLFEAFVSHMTKLTCVFGRSAAITEKIDGDDTAQSEAYECMLEGWMSFVSGFPDTSCDLLKYQAIEIFNCFLECSLSSADKSTNVDDNQSDIDEICEDDRDKYCDQLTSIGQFGNIVPSHCVPLLTKLMEERISSLDDHLQRLGKEPQLRISLDALYDDLHWLILIAGHVLTEDTQGETPMIPAAITRYCSEQTGTDPATTHTVLTSPSLSPDSLPDVDATVDNVVRLTSTLFRLWHVVKRAIERGQLSDVSPQLVSTSMWFIQQWARFYLLPDESHYTTVSYKMSDILLSTFGQDTVGGQWCLEHIIDKVVFNVNHWFSEESVITDSLNALLAVVSSPARCNAAVKCHSLWSLAKSEASGTVALTALTPRCKRLLLQALVTVGCGMTDTTDRDTYWKQVLVSIYERFENTVRQPNFSQVCQTSDVKLRVTSLLESISGVIDASTCTNATSLFGFLRPLLPDIVQLLEHYHNCEDIIPVTLEVFSLLVHKQLAYISQSDTQCLYEMCIATIQLYAKHHLGRHQSVNMDCMEEDKFTDLSIILETLTGLLSKEFFDFGENDVTSGGGTTTSVSDVVLYGFKTVIPVMSTALLKFPSLCWQYFKLITILAETYPEKFTEIPSDLYDNLMTSVEIGLHGYGEEVTKMSLEIIESLSTYCLTSSLPSTSKLSMTLSLMLKRVTQLLLAATFDMDLIDVASTCFFSLVCSNQEEYHRIANELVQCQADESSKNRLQAAFQHLTPPDFTPSIARPVKVAFLDRFCQFLINIRAFVCVR